MILSGTISLTLDLFLQPSLGCVLVGHPPVCLSCGLRTKHDPHPCSPVPPIPAALCQCVMALVQQVSSRCAAVCVARLIMSNIIPDCSSRPQSPAPDSAERCAAPQALHSSCTAPSAQEKRKVGRRKEEKKMVHSLQTTHRSLAEHQQKPLLSLFFLFFRLEREREREMKI